MSYTESTLSLLSDRQRSTLELYKANYRATKDDKEHRSKNRELLSSYRANITGYITALEDCGVINTTQQARALYTYATL